MTDECIGVTSPSEGQRHIPPASKRRAGSADVQENGKCLWNGSQSKWDPRGKQITKEQAKDQVTIKCPDDC